MVSGGIERVTLTLAAEFIKQGHSCVLALRHRTGEFLPEADLLLPVHELAPTGLQQFVPSLTQLIKEWQPTHIITAFHDIALLTLLSKRLAKSRAHLVHGAHNSHDIASARPGITGRLRYMLEWRLAAFIYKRANAIVAVSQGVKREITEDFHIPSNRIAVIYNPVQCRASTTASRVRISDITHRPIELMALGRLAHQKGFDVLIEAMSQLVTSRSWSLDIYGSGPEFDSLQAAIARSGLNSRIELKGHTNTPLDEMDRADVFILPSRHEGLGIVLVEAMSCGTQIVATDCPHGPSEILLGGQLGQLVPTESAKQLANAIDAVLEGRHWVSPDRLIARSAEFQPEAAAKAWIDWMSREDNHHDPRGTHSTF